MAAAEQVQSSALRSEASSDRFIATLDEAGLARVVAVDARTTISPYRPDRPQVVGSLCEREPELRPIAERILASSAAREWSLPLDAGRQRWVAFDPEPPQRRGFTSPAHPFPALATKPLGGLWTTTAFDETRSAWLWPELTESRTPVRLWQPVTNTDLAVYEIDGLQDWTDLCAEYGEDTTLIYGPHLAASGFEFHQPFYTPRWAALAQDFDAVHLTWLGLIGTFGVLNDCRDGSCGLFGWDVESTLWLRWSFRSWDAVGGVEAEL